MKIVVTYKWAADYQEASVAAQGRVDWSRARPVVSEYDAVAIQAARQLSESTSGEVIGLTAGGPEVASAMALKTALARGLDRGVAVTDETLASAGTARYAQVLARAIEQIGGVELVLAGDSSIDIAAKMVHVLVAGHLGWPVITEASGVEAGDGKVRLRRLSGGRTETVELALPAVVVLASDALKPRVPGMRDVLQAGKKPVQRLGLDALGLPEIEPTYTVRSTAKPERRARRGRVIDTSDAALAAKELVNALRDEGAL